MIYLDSSCLLKLLFDEPESAAVRQAIGREADVVVSVLTELETTVQLSAIRRAAALGERRFRAYRDRLRTFREIDPFRFSPLAGSVFQTALGQLRRGRPPHCRSLDRLHLAAMEELGLRRLMSNDVAQGAAARALGFEVTSPGRD